MAVPNPTPIYRIVHVENLPALLSRGGLHASHHTPSDGLVYRTIHNVDIQDQRQVRPIPCGPGGTIHDYVAFYFGPRSPMLYQLHTGWVKDYREGQEPLVYVVATAQEVAAAGCRFVFSNGHGIAAFTSWFDDLERLDEVDWDMVYQRYWFDNVNDMDRQRRKQAEFLVYHHCEWGLIRQIGVVNDAMKSRVERTLAGFPKAVIRPVNIRRQWYY